MKLVRNIQGWLKSKGIEVRKAPSVDWAPLPVFDLSVQWLMTQRGEGLRFIQVGANDGVYGDPIRKYITENGWKGILCEPQADVFERLRVNYVGNEERLIFEMVAISSDDTGLTMYRKKHNLKPGEEMPHGLTVTSADPRIVAHQAGCSVDELESFKVPTVTLDDLVEKHGFDSFDLLQIDVEGFDLTVLQTLSLTKYRPAVIQLEHGHLSRSDVSEVARHFMRHDYLFYYGGYSTDSLAMPRELL